MRRVLVFAAFAALVVVPWAGALGRRRSVNLSGTSGDGGWFRSSVIVTWTINLNGESLVSLTGCQNETISSEASTRDGVARCRPAEARRRSGRRRSNRLDEPDDRWRRSLAWSRPGGLVQRRSASSRRRVMQSPGRGRVPVRTPAPTVRRPPAASPASTSPGTARPRRPAVPVRRHAADDRWGVRRAVLPTRTAGTTTRSSSTSPRTTSPGGALHAGELRGPDGAGAAVPSRCTDVAGNASTGSASINDDDPPLRWGSPDRGPDANGWYARPVSVSIGGSDGTSGVAGCSGGGTYSGPDGRGSVGGCTDNAGNTGSGGVEIPYDSTAPGGDRCAGRPSGGRERLVEPRGLVPVRRQRRGSGVAECTTRATAAPTRRRPPSAARAPIGPGTRARRSSTVQVRRDAAVALERRRPGREQVRALKWKISNDVASVRVTRKPGRAGEGRGVVFSGKADFFKDTGIDNRASYEYVVAAADEAANGVERPQCRCRALQPGRRRARASAGRARVALDRARDVLQPPGLVQEKEADHDVAEAHQARDPAARQAQRPLIRAPSRLVPLVRVPRLRAVRRAALRQARRAEHVRRDSLAGRPVPARAAAA